MKIENIARKNITSKNITWSNIAWIFCSVALYSASTTLSADTVVIQKQGTNFSIDGNRQSIQEGLQAYLWGTDVNNRNQKWVEVDRGSGYYSYQKIGTSLCLDGGRGGAAGQAVILFNCGDRNFNQHWKKVSTGGDSYRLEKRNSPAYSIDGNNGAGPLQGIYLWDSNSRNRNQQWQFFVDGSTRPGGGGGGTVDLNISSLSELQDAVQRNNQNIVMRPGRYSAAELRNDNRGFRVSGRNNNIDLTDVRIEFPVALGASQAHFIFSGTGNTLKGGTIENTYANGMTEVTDFVSYNLDRDNLAKGGKPHMEIQANDTTILDTKMIVRGSFPYGYGSYFGIGGRNSFGLSKRGAIQINSSNTVLDGVDIKMEAFGHAIYIGPGAGEVTDNTIIRNTRVEGVTRLTNDMLGERGGLMALNDYKDHDGNDVPRNDEDSLAEDGFRTYPDAGSVFVENSTVIGMRTGIILHQATENTVTNSTSLDNRVGNIRLGNNGRMRSSTANFKYGRAFWADRSNMNVDLTILPTPDAYGPHNIADIERGGNTVIFRRARGPEVRNEDRVIRVASNDNTITNYTEYTIVLESGTRGNTIISAGSVEDNGSNDVRRIDLEL